MPSPQSLHDALRLAGYLPSEHDTHWNACSTLHVTLMSDLADDQSDRIHELEHEIGGLETDLRDCRNDCDDLTRERDEARAECVELTHKLLELKGTKE